MTSIYENAARDLFSNLRKEVQRFEEDEPTVTMSFFEVAGDSCSDLLNGFRHIQLVNIATVISLQYHYYCMCCAIADGI